MKLSEIKALERLTIIGEDREIDNVSTPKESNEASLVFYIGNSSHWNTKVHCIITTPEFKDTFSKEYSTIIISSDPKLTMAKVILECFEDKNARIKYRALENGIKMYDCVKKDSYIIGANCTLGLCGFGYIWDEGHWLRFPHIGGVVIESDVEIGSNVCIDRGSIGNTHIRQGVKIDNLVHIAHNADIGEHTLIVAGAVIGGSVKIGKKCFIGMNASIKNGVTIGDNVTVGAGAVVLKDIPDGETWAGVPAKKL